MTINDATVATFYGFREVGGGGCPFSLMEALKFERIGRHPMLGHPLNVVEQVNQTWSWIAALRAAEVLLEWHPETEGLELAPDATMSIDLDIMSFQPGLVGAEVFAAVDPRNNRKIAKDVAKMAQRPEQHRYVFFMSPMFPNFERQEQFEKDGVQVWSLRHGS